MHFRFRRPRAAILERGRRDTIEIGVLGKGMHFVAVHARGARRRRTRADRATRVRWVMPMVQPTIVVLVGLACGSSQPNAASPALLPPTRLRTDHRVRPLSVQRPPRLSWALADTASLRAVRQAAFQLQLSNATHQIWDSGKIESNRSVLDHCCGAVVFASDASFSWRVKTWQTSAGTAVEQTSPWSMPAHFDTALLNGSDWGDARWLGTGDGIGTPESARNLFRTEFRLPPQQIVRARAFISGLGYYRMHVNGQRADDHELGTLTVYERSLLYDAIDIAPLLHAGATNAVGIALGRGWYSCSGCLALRLGSACGRAGTVNTTNPYGDNTCGQYADWPLGPTGIVTCASPCPRSFILRLVVSFADGSSFTLVSDPSSGEWQQSNGPVVSESIYLGVVHDGRLEQPGWTLPAYVPQNATRWVPAHAPAATPSGAPATLKAQTMPQIRKIRAVAPKAITTPRPGVFLVDFGTNVAGWAKINISGAAVTRGHNVTMVYGEILTNYSSCWSCLVPFKSNISRAQSCPCRSEVEMRYNTAPMVDTYIFRGDGADEKFEPIGTYHGFR
eukprot:COSAG02_NODE_2824_length_7947_cov_2.690494_6_plen_562_part_00